MARIDLPDYELDPYYKQSQETLFPFGKGLLSGDVPDYYKTIGESGGKEFEDVLGLAKRDVTRTGLESAAKMGVRGPRAAFGIGQNVGELTRKLRFEDLMAAKEGKRFLMGKGLETLSGTRSAALSQTGMRGQFDLSRSGMELDMKQFNEEMAFKQQQLEAEKKAARNKMWADIFSSVVGTAGAVALAPYTGGASLALGGAGKTMTKWV